MKTTIVLALLIANLIAGCGKEGTGSPVNHQLIINGVSIATSTGLSFIKDEAQRKVIADYLQAYAPGLRTITSAPTAEQLGTMIDQYTPASVKAQYPQVIAFATPIIINAVESAITRYGKDNATVIAIVNDVAVGLETGTAVKH